MIEENAVIHDEVVKVETITTTTRTQVPEEHKALYVSVVAGAINTLSSQDPYKLAPTAAIETYAQTSDSLYTPDLAVKVNLSSLPGESISLNDASSFTSLEFEVGLSQKIPGIFPKLYGGFGIATRLPGEDKPRNNAAKYFTGGIIFSTHDNSSYLYVGGGPDQRLDSSSYYLINGHIEGMLKLYNYKDAKLSLRGNAILGGSSSLVRIGIVVGI